MRGQAGRAVGVYGDRQVNYGAFDHDNVPGERKAMYRDAGMLCACCDFVKNDEDSAVCEDCDDRRYEVAPW